MKDNIYKLKIWCKNHKLLIALSVFIFILIFVLIKYVIFMHNKIVFDFPKNEDKNVVEYYSALSQLYGGIIGGIVGGIFTVIGVGITVYVANCDRKSDLIMADKPKLMTGGNIEIDKNNKIVPELNDLYENGNKMVYVKKELSKINKTIHLAKYNSFGIFVTDHADCVLEGIILGEKMIYSFENPYILNKGKTYDFDLSNYYFVMDGNIYNEITLICSSLSERRYYFTFSSDEIEKKIGNHKVLELSVSFLDERIYGYDKKIKLLHKKLDEENTKYIIERIRSKREKNNNGNDLK